MVMFHSAQKLWASPSAVYLHIRTPAQIDPQHADLFYPQELGSRYAEVVHQIDEKNVLVNFEFNGGDRENPAIIESGKGYFFHDNSAAWAQFAQYASEQGESCELRLNEFSIKDGIQRVYVIPQYSTVHVERDMRIWSSTDKIPALKIGYEDYYRHEVYRGKGVIAQADYLFQLPGSERDNNLIIQSKLYPPHRTVLESNTFRRTIFFGRKAGGITALVGATQRDEERYIEAGEGLSRETFVSWSFSAISGGGRLSSEKDGVRQHITDFGYVLCKDYEQKAPFFTQMNGHGGNYLVVEDADLNFFPQESINPTSQELKVRLSKENAYASFPQNVQEHKEYLLPYTFQIEGEGNFFKVFALGGSNRLNTLIIEGKEAVLSFIMNAQGVRSDNPGELMGYWEYCYVPINKRMDWNWSRNAPSSPGRSPTELILLEQIPVKGKRYTVSREYKIREENKHLGHPITSKVATVNPKGNKASQSPNEGEMYSNVLRTAPCWTTILGKYANDIDPEKDIPSNGKPLALQPGDRFKIPAYPGSTHDTKVIYEVTRKDKGMWPSFPVEFVSIRNRKDWKYDRTNFQSYRYFWCELDKDLPPSLGITFEIEMVESMSEELLDGKARTALQTYKGTGRMAPKSKGRPNDRGDAMKPGFYNKKMSFDDPYWREGEPMGHLCYSQVELTEWYKNVQWAGYYRQNSNDGLSFKKYSIKSEGKSVKVSPIARYSQGKTFINCTGGPAGQYSNGLNDFWIVDQIQQTEGIKVDQKVKMRIYNSPDVRYEGVKLPENYVEIYESDSNAPDMPRACRELLNSLPGVS